MNLLEHYNSLYQTSAKEIVAGNYVLDKLLGSPTDDRFGITLLIRPDEAVKCNIQALLEELMALEPAQYYYPASDIHVTAMSIISCYSGFALDQVSVADYVEVITQSIRSIGSFEICFCGVTASKSAVMVQGFPSNGMLEKLRHNLRRNFKATGLQESIDKRYTIATAHATIMRFCEPLQDTKGLVNALDRYRTHAFGNQHVTQLELVYNDWYQRERFVKPLHSFYVGSQLG